MDDICFLDWQTSRFVSPVFDFYHIISTSTDKTLRDKEYKNLLNHYYLTLSSSIKMLGSDTNLFSRSDFDEHLKKFGSWAVIISVFSLFIQFADPESMADMDDLSERLKNNSELGVKLNEATKNEYTERMQYLVGDFYDWGLYVKSI